MPNWTKEQLLAINESGKNIIVSAGAGSGKTAVLTERVITKLKSGTNIQNLLILTFTNAAATEMKDRIRSSIKMIPSLKEQLDYLDSAYITTFDSFSMSLVKKYHYLLNVSPKINIVEKTICDTVRSSLLEEIFLEKYENKDRCFLKLVDNLCIKDDTEIKKNILNINNSVDKLINREEYLNSYVDNYYEENNINRLVTEYMNLIVDKQNNIRLLLNDLSNYCEVEYFSKVNDTLFSFLNTNNYDEMKLKINIKLPNAPKSSPEELKETKAKIMEEIKNIKGLLIYKDVNHLKNTLMFTKDYAIAIIDILNLLNERLLNYKKINDQYEFNDIAKMAIKLVKDNRDIKEEIMLSFTEIMVDEYQDTSDLQEELVSLISNNNVYMVGDIKQSIYRFRNANPDIFKAKYEKFSNNNGGIKIDLLNNFRSRKEVLDDINSIFDLVMSSDFGGANYRLSHRMNFGNMMYSDNDPNQNKNLEIISYQRDDKKYSNSEYEAFIIANDIKKRIENKYQVLDKDTKILRDTKYGDFCILLDRKSNFELYKKIFEYLGIPLVIYYDEKITNEKDVLIIKNIIDMIVKIYLHEDFRYDFYSISRSYVGNISDECFSEYYINNNYKDNEIYKICLDISKHLFSISNKELIEEIVDKFNFYEKVITVGEMEKFIIRVDYLKSLGDNLSKLGYSVIEFNNYLKNLVLNDADITLSISPKASDNVKLMNIHKSKGLEFPICYFAGYTSKFNKMDLNSRMSFNKDLGLILPFYDDGIGNTIIKELNKDKYLKEDISERIRLFYVALTRAKEKMIIVTSLTDKEYILTDELKLQYNSFLSIIESIKSNITNRIINIEDTKLTKNYKYSKEKNISIEQDNKIIVKELNIDKEIITISKASKIINKIMNNKSKDTLEYGTKIHRLLEVSDLLNSNNDIVKKFREKIGNLKDAKIYKEYEFNTVIDNKEYNGIIDLILEYSDHIDIIDYKLKNIDDDNYLKQLKVYKDFVYNKLHKKTTTYLYSIVNNELKEIRID